MKRLPAIQVINGNRMSPPCRSNFDLTLSCFPPGSDKELPYPHNPKQYTVVAFLLPHPTWVSFFRVFLYCFFLLEEISTRLINPCQPRGTGKARWHGRMMGRWAVVARYRLFMGQMKGDCLN
jgi:hypothetical protein